MDNAGDIPPWHPWQLPVQHVGRQVRVYACTDSTNNRAAELAGDAAHHGTVILAKEQTAGRGQYGRSWRCPAGSGVLLSVLLFPPPALCRPAVLTAWAAVSVCATIRRVAKLQARIKWPNDVLLRGRKVCGILLETKAQGALAMIAGIGLNVNQPAEAFTAPGLEHGTSLALAAGRPFAGEAVAQLLIRQLDEEYQRLAGGDLATLEACWQGRLGLLGKQVAAECVGTTYHGRLEEVGFDGIALQRPGQDRLRLQPEAIRHLRPG